jgi:lactate dehydrogenase-like 2-hydroxyacid dehydrogenase
MKPKIFISRKIPDRGLNKIKEYFDIDLWPKYAPPSKKQIIRRIKNVDGMVSLLSDKIDAEVMDAAPYLSIIAQLAVGYDNIDIFILKPLALLAIALPILPNPIIPRVASCISYPRNISGCQPTFHFPLRT